MVRQCRGASRRNRLSLGSLDFRLTEREQGTLKAQALRSATAVRKVLQSFRDKYTAETITKLYPGPLDVAVKVRL